MAKRDHEREVATKPSATPAVGPKVDLIRSAGARPDKSHPQHSVFLCTHMRSM